MMRWNSVLLLVMAVALCACGAHGGGTSLKAAGRPVIQDLPSQAGKSEARHPETEELCLVLPLPQDPTAQAVAEELDAYKTAIVGILRTEPQARLRITTHSALLGSQKESQERTELIARAVKEYLLEKSALDPLRISIRPKGAEVPLFANSSAYGRAKNNRLELRLEHISKAGQAPASPAAPRAAVSALPASAPKIFQNVPRSNKEALARTYTLRFSTGRSSLQGAMLQQAREIAVFLKNNPGVKARIMGHTDAIGSKANNQRLSYQRALELQIVLLTKFGVPAARTEVIGYGEERPVADNRTAEGRSKNRRVEIAMLPYKPVVRYAGVAPRSVVPGASAPPAAVARRDAPSASPVAALEPAKTQNYRQRLERLAKLYGAREVVYSGGVRYVPLQSTGNMKNYRIEISVSKCTLWLYRVLPDGSKLLVRPYKVATAKKGVPYPKGVGYVTAIDYDPWWYPTARMVRRAAAKGRRLAPVPPGSRRNPMGAFKIYLSHGNNGGSFRIHGTNKPSLIGRRVSQGCIRMTNKDGLELARTIQPGTEVVVYQ